jgi:hypothetical protein
MQTFSLYRTVNTHILYYKDHTVMLHRDVTTLQSAHMTCMGTMYRFIMLNMVHMFTNKIYGVKYKKAPITIVKILQKFVAQNSDLSLIRASKHDYSV